MIRIEHLSKSFGRAKVVNDVSLGIELGESVALWGSNGAGKTTILRCIAGLYAHEGQISVDTLDTRRTGKAARQLIGYVPQESALDDNLRVSRALEFFADLRGIRLAGVQDALETVGLSDHRRKRVRELSGGMKQRLALAIALLGEPPVLLLDEVTASLDLHGREELIRLLARVARTDRRAILFASHRVEEIAALATRVLILERGRVVRDLSRDDFVHEFGRAEYLHLFMDLESASRALHVLNTRGFEARLNGHGLLVRVRVGQRMQPIDLLQTEQLRIHDMELLATPGKEGVS
jgi:ABC-type multidrug transport system ATPase subunit